MLKNNMENCGTFFRGHSHADPKDENGCIKPNGHHDAHEFIDSDGRHIEWEYDYSCTCGCWNDIEYDFHGCMIYHVIY